jgi:CelD/BcsL family acetyltransferase involved in cellulose biosynthesis
MADPVPGRWSGEPAEWDRFVEESNNGTVFHRLDWLAYHGDRFAANAHHVAWRKGDALRAVMPLGFFEQDGGLVARSPFGASYGGIVVPAALGLVRAQQLVDSLLEYLRGQGVRKLVVTPPPDLYWSRPHDYLEFALLRRGGACVRSDLTSYIEVTDEPLEGFRHSAVKAVRKATDNDVRIEPESRAVDAFYDILAANREKFGATPTHSREEVRWLVEKLPAHIKLFMAYRDDTPIAGSLVFRCNTRVILDFYWAHVDEYQGLRPISLLVYEITRWARREGIAYFDFGTQTIDMVPVEGSTRFKETFGAVGMFRRTYELELR